MSTAVVYYLRPAWGVRAALDYASHVIARVAPRSRAYGRARDESQRATRAALRIDGTVLAMPSRSTRSASRALTAIDHATLAAVLFAATDTCVKEWRAQPKSSVDARRWLRLIHALDQVRDALDECGWRDCRRINFYFERAAS